MDMSKLFKDAKAKITGKKPKDKAAKPDNDYQELVNVWPNGTWKLPKVGDNDMDEVVRGVLLSVWGLEAFIKAEEAAGRKLNPAMLGDRPDPIPKGWKVSKRALDHYAQKNNVSDEKWKHVVGKLTEMKELAP